jgi:hypothetical protein
LHLKSEKNWFQAFVSFKCNLYRCTEEALEVVDVDWSDDDDDSDDDVVIPPRTPSPEPEPEPEPEEVKLEPIPLGKPPPLYKLNPLYPYSLKAPGFPTLESLKCDHLLVSTFALLK